MMKIYTLGNILLEEDRLALDVAEELKSKFKSIKFIEYDPIETVEGDVWFMDIVKGIEDVAILDENCFEQQKIYTTHDLDLSQMLPLLQKVGKIKSFKFIAIPFGMNKKEAVRKVAKLLKHFST